MNTTLWGYLLVLLSAATFASTSLFLKWAFQVGLDVWSFTYLHSVLSLLLIGVWALWERRPFFPHRRPPVGLLLLFGTSGAAAAIAFNVALVHLSISLSTLLLFTYPAFVVAGTWLLLAQRPTRYDVLALMLTIAGASLTSGYAMAEARASLMGLTLALFAAMAHACYMLTGVRLGERASPLAATLLTRVMILLGVLAIRPSVMTVVPDSSGWWLLIISTVIAGIAPFLFLYQGMALIGANRAAIVSVAELPIAMALGLLFLSEQISLGQTVGTVCILIAMLISRIRPTAAP